VNQKYYITTTRLRTQHCEFVNFWRKIAFPCFRKFLVLQICHLVIFDLSPKLKSRVNVYHFQTPDSVQKAVTDAIKTLKEADFQSRWAKCVASERRYFERNNVDLDE
jgi:hypothetical protein